MHRALAIVTLLTLSVALVATGTLAQSPTGLTDLGYSELSVTVTDEGFDAPDTIPSGRYLVSLNNQGTQDYNMSIMGIAEGGPALEELFASPQGADEDGDEGDEGEEGEEDDEAIPEWLEFHGGIGSLRPGTSAQAIIDLIAGEYFLFTFLNEEASYPLIVTEGDDPDAAPEPPADGTVNMTEFSFTVPETLAAGPQIFKIENTGSEPHMFQLGYLPEGMTQEQAMLLFTTDEDSEGTPAVPAGLEDYTLEELMQEVYATGGISALEPGTAQWMILDLEPGTYSAACYVTNEQGPHFAQGMFVVFTVA